ncbi:MAG: phosphatidate cytidylyltransferase, partial [Pseudomonadota bacterium]
MTDTDRWSDLRTRILSALILSAIGLAAIWAGGAVFVALVGLICGLIIWETSVMHQARYPVALGVTGSVLPVLCAVLPVALIAPLILGLGVVAAGQVSAHKARFCIMVCWVLIGAFSMLLMRIGVGMGWILWLILLVIATDVAGYFAGRRLGGPKFWPAVSPKKTWSGT